MKNIAEWQLMLLAALLFAAAGAIDFFSDGLDVGNGLQFIAALLFALVALQKRGGA